MQLADADIHRSERTIQRNLSDIVKYFHDVDVDTRDKPYGYRRRSKSIFSNSAHEAVLLSLAEKYLIHLLPSSLISTFDGLFQDAKLHLYPSSGNSKERLWLRKVRFISETQPLNPPQIDSEVLYNISIALYHNRHLSIKHEGNNKYTKDVMPLGLAQQGKRLLLVYRELNSKTEKISPINRIRSASVSSFQFDYPNDFDLEKFELKGGFSQGKGQEISLQIQLKHPSGKLLKESPLSDDQEIVEMDESYIIKATVVDSQTLDRWIHSFGEDLIAFHKAPINKNLSK